MMQKTPRRPRLSEIHSTIERSKLTKATKALLRFIVNSRLQEFSFGVHTVAEKLKLDPTTVRAALRKIDNTSDAGAAILELVREAKHGTQPRVYRIKIDRITAENLDRAASGMVRAIGGESDGEFPALGLLAGIPRPKSPPIRARISDVLEADNGRDGAEQPQPKESRSNVIPLPSRQRGAKAEALQGEMHSLAARGVA
jgi:hypothetical protein